VKFQGVAKFYVCVHRNTSERLHEIKKNECIDFHSDLDFTLVMTTGVRDAVKLC